MKNLRPLRSTGLIFLVFGLFMAMEARANSIYSRYGIGIVQYYTGARSFGMGGAGIAVLSSASLNYMNPAALPFVRATRFDGSMHYERTDIDIAGQTGRLENTRFHSVQFALPIKNGAAVAFGLAPFSEVNFTIESRISGEAYEGTQSRIGSGGVVNGFVKFGVRVTPWLLAGAGFDVYFGRIENTLRVLFDTPDYDPTRDVRAAYVRGLGGHFGLAFLLGQKLTLGSVVHLPARLDVDEEKEFIFGEVRDLHEGQVKLPLRLGYGVAFQATQALLLTGDFSMQQWGDISSASLRGAQGVDTRVIAAGLELWPQGRRNALLKKLIYRAGFRTSKLPYYDANGTEVTENLFTFGITVPFLGDRSKFDLGLEFGTRGKLDENIAEEKVVRLHLGITGGELWFQRQR